MKIVFSRSDEDKVDLFLKMVDEDGGGTYGFEEIRGICLLTFESSSAPKYDENGNLEPDILLETAEFQAKNIFNLLNFDHDDEIPIEVFKHEIFNGDEETRAALR